MIPPTKRHGSPSGRWMAFRAVQAFHQRGAFVSSVLDSLFEESGAEPRERGFATELAAEIVRRRLTIDTVLSRYVTRPRETVEDDLWILLQLGCCQLLFLAQVPPHAAVNETVKLCDRLRKPRARAFINGILRGIEREIVAPVPVEAPILADCGPRTIAILNSRDSSFRVVELARDLFPSPDSDPLGYISAAASLPRWLLDRVSTQAADHERLLHLALWLATPGRMSLRVNLLQTTRERTLEVLRAAGVECTPGILPEAISLAGSVAVGDLPGFREGWFSVQDESAMVAVDLLAPRPGERVLDLCAAPGGKATHIAERLHGEGEVLACDLSERRLETVTENVRRLKLANVQVQQVSAGGEGIPRGPFQAVLIDVPCSNTGVLGKRPEARWRLTPRSFAELVPLQRRLLGEALSRTAEGGRVVYATCSIDAEENEGVVGAVLADHPRFQLVEERRHQPGNPADGGYQALLIRK